MSVYATSVGSTDDVRRVIPVIDPPVMDTVLLACVAIVPRPRFVREVDAFPRSLRLLCFNITPLRRALLIVPVRLAAVRFVMVVPSPASWPP